MNHTRNHVSKETRRTKAQENRSKALTYARLVSELHEDTSPGGGGGGGRAASNPADRVVQFDSASPAIARAGTYAALTPGAGRAAADATNPAGGLDMKALGAQASRLNKQAPCSSPPPSAALPTTTTAATAASSAPALTTAALATAAALTLATAALLAFRPRHHPRPPPSGARQGAAGAGAARGARRPRRAERRAAQLQRRALAPVRAGHPLQARPLRVAYRRCVRRTQPEQSRKPSVRELVKVWCARALAPRTYAKYPSYALRKFL